MTIAPILLASASPRRRQLLSLLGIPYDCCVSPVNEEALQEQYRGPIEGMAQWLAEQKALGVHTLPEAADRFIVTADTTVLLQGDVLGKPRDRAHARELLWSLRNRWHNVVTGLSVSRKIGDSLEMYNASCTTPVLMRAYSEEDVMAYIATGDPLDKAGAYGIQHPQFQPTANIQGCYLNIVGLPICTLIGLLANFDIHPTTTGRPGSACPWSEHCQITV